MTVCLRSPSRSPAPNGMDRASLDSGTKKINPQARPGHEGSFRQTGPLDRLTRSLADFAKLVELFDAQGVSVVSVTQQFNTASSMGRLTLNVLLSFAQFEREVTGERIRDKIAASKKKGMWMGGIVPLGYDASERTLVVNAAEAETVRCIFALYRELGCVRRVKGEADRLGLSTKRSTTAGGIQRGGQPFSRRPIHNPP